MKKEGRNKQASKDKQTTNQSNTTHPIWKNELPRVGFKPMTLYTLGRMLHQLSYQNLTSHLRCVPSVHTCLVIHIFPPPLSPPLLRHLSLPLSLPQLVQSSQASVVLPSLPTLEGHTPRSWNLSADGSLVVVGFEKGALQVKY